MGTFPGLTDPFPYVSVSGFKAHPTYLDFANLRSGDPNAADQDRQLHQVLMEASNWADSICKLPLSGHLQTDNARLRPDSRGRLFLYPDHAPVRRLLSYQYGYSPGQVSSVITGPAYSLESNRQIIVQLAGAALTSWAGPLQLNGPGSFNELYVQWQYVAGFMNGLLGASCSVGASSVTVTDPTGIEPGDIFRIWDPGKEEALTVAASYTPSPVAPPVPTAIPLVGTTQFAHTSDLVATGNMVVCSSLPADAYLAVVYLGIDVLQRYGSADNIWPGMPVPSATRDRERPNSLWVQRAIQLLAPFMDVR